MREKSNTICSAQYSSQKDVRYELAAFVALVTIVSLLLRFYRVSEQSLWMDEVASFNNTVAFETGGMAGLATVDHIAPLHSMMLWLVTRFGPPSEFILRLPSVIFGVATVPVFSWLVHDMFRNSKLTAIAAVLICISPFAIWYSQEARMYSSYLFFSVALLALSWRASERPFGIVLWLSLVIISTLGLYTHHFTALLIFAFSLCFLGRAGLFSARLWAWGSSQAVAVALFLYWMYLTSEKLGAAAGTAKPMFPLWIPYTIFSFSFGPTLGPSIADIRNMGVRSLVSYQGAIAAAAALCLAYLIYRGLREVLRGETRRAGIWCIVWLGLPMLLGILATQITNISYNPRYVIASFPALLIVLAAGLSAMRSKVSDYVVAIAMTFFMVIALSNHYWNPAYAREDVRPVASLLNSSFQPGSVLVANNSRIRPILLHYGARLPDNVLQLDPGPSRSAPNLNEIAAEVKRTIAQPGAKVWLIQYRSWESDPDFMLKAVLDESGQLMETQSWPGVSLRIYSSNSKGNS